MSDAAYDVVIVGAGIVGAACADEFARRGLRVAVVDRDTVGSGATAAGMGHIVVMDDSEAQFALTRYSQHLWQQLRQELPDDVEYEQCGTIWVATDAGLNRMPAQTPRARLVDFEMAADRARGWWTSKWRPSIFFMRGC